MQGGRGGRNPFSDFPDPFGGFGSFPGFGGGRSMMPGFFGGQDPFDDPFFTRPFGGGMFEPSFFGSAGLPFPRMHPIGSPFPGMHPTGFIEQQPLPPEPRRNGPIIEEINSDDENEEADNNNNTQKKENNRKHGRSSKQSYVQDPDEEVEERRSKQRVNEMQPHHQGHSFTFQSSTVTYGGANGAYYTSSNTKRTGSDGLTFEERKEADSTTGQASHKISRALHKKGHSLERKLNSDGRVDSRQTLHNLNEDELVGFEEAWKGKAQRHLPGWTGNFGGNNNIGISGNGQNAGGWALPSTEQAGMVRPDPIEMAVPSRAHQSGRTKKGKERSGDYSRGKGRD